MKENNETKKEIKFLPVIIGLVAGVLLLFVGKGNPFGISTQSVSATESGVYDEARYEAELIDQIEGVCRRVRGAGSVSVAVTLDGSYRAIYAQNFADGSNSKREYFLLGSGSSEKALLLGYSPPDILGVAIVCEGGSSSAVRAEIISLVSALLDLPTNKIYVAASNN